MVSMKTITKFLLSSGSVIGLMTTTPVLAQASNSVELQKEEVSSRGGIDEIVVTARKRGEGLIDVPVAVTALTAADIAARGIVDYTGLNDFAPGFRYETQGSSVATRGFNTFVMRGIYPGSDSPERQAVSIFIDGAPVGGGGAIPGLTDVQQVEVVKGPQSAYFGRSTFAGAVNFITRQPSFEPHVNIDATIGNYGGRELKAALEGGIIPDVLAARVSARHYHAGGQYDNFGHSGKLGEKETDSYAGSLYFTPTDDLKLRASYTAWEDEDGAPAQAYLTRDDYNCDAGAGVGGALNYICGPINLAPADRISQYTDAPFAVFDGLAERNPVHEASFLTKPGLHRKAHQGFVSADYELPSNYSLSANYGWGRNKWGHMVDTANRPTGYAWFIVPYDIKTQSAELRLASDQNKRLKFMIGGNWFSQETHTGSFSNKNPSPNTTPISPFNRGQALTRTTTDTYGIFGSATYDFDEALSLSLEGRYQWDEISQQTLAPIGTKLAGTTRSFTPRAIVQYKIDSDLNIYASYSEGTRPAQFNAALATLSPSVLAQLATQANVPLKVDEERLRMAELGLKGSFFDGRLQLLSALYFGKWSDKQIQVTLGYFNPTFTQINLLVPAGKVNVYGLEVEGKFAVNDELTLEGTFAYNETDIRNTSCSECRVITGNGNPVGNRLPRYPAYTGSFSVNYERHAFADFFGYARADYIYTGKQYATEANMAWTGDRSIVNLRIGIQNGMYRFELWGKNIFDDKTPVNIGRTGDTFAGVNNLIIGPAERATYGIRASFVY